MERNDQAITVTGTVEEGSKAFATPARQAETLISTILKAATNPKVDMDKMERLLALHKEMVAEQQKQVFIGAMARAQAAMVRVATNQRNTQTSSNYADYAAIDRMARPLYSAEGISLTFDTEDAKDPGEIRIVCDVMHTGGHVKRYHIDMPSDGKGAKGGDVMTKTHATGSAAAYGKRYLVLGIFNLAIGKDDDGNKAGGQGQTCISADEALELEDLAKTAKADIPAFLNLLDAGSFAEIYAKDFKRAKGMLNQKIRVLEKKGEL